MKYFILIILSFFLNFTQIFPCQICNTDEIIIVQVDNETEEIHHDVSAHFQHARQLINNDNLQEAFVQVLEIIEILKKNNDLKCEDIIELLLQTLPHSSQLTDHEYKEVLIKKLIQLNRKHEAFQLIINDEKLKKRLDLVLQTIPFCNEYVRQNCLNQVIQLALNDDKLAYKLALQLEQDIILYALAEYPYAYEFVIRHSHIWIKYINQLKERPNRTEEAFQQIYNLMQTYSNLDKTILLKLYLNVLPFSAVVIKKYFEKELLSLAQKNDDNAIKFLNENPAIKITKAALRKLRCLPIEN